MAKTANLYARIEPEIKKEAEDILEKLGIPVSVAINLFYKQIILQQGIPFKVSLQQDKQRIDVSTDSATTRPAFKNQGFICSDIQTTYNTSSPKAKAKIDSLNLKNFKLTSTEEPSDEMLAALMQQVGIAARKSSEDAESAMKRMQANAFAAIAKNRHTKGA